MRFPTNTGKEPNIPNDWYVEEDQNDANPLLYLQSCPFCGSSFHTHIMQKYRSPRWTWEHLCGREGYLVICGNCQRKIKSIITIMN